MSVQSIIREAHTAGLLIIGRFEAFQQLLLRNFLRAQKIAFSFCSATKVATFWKYVCDAKCACTVFRQGEVLLPTDWLSSASSPQSHFTRVQLYGRKKQTKQKCASPWCMRWKFCTLKLNSMCHLCTDGCNWECWWCQHMLSAIICTWSIEHSCAELSQSPFCVSSRVGVPGCTSIFQLLVDQCFVCWVLQLSISGCCCFLI